MSCPDPPGDRPTFIPVPLTARSVMRYTIFGQTVENVFHFSKATDYNTADLDALNGAITTSWTANIRPLLPADALLEDITSTALDQLPQAQDIDIVSAAGSNAGAAFETTGNTLCIKFGTGQAGRSYRGRMYWPVLMDAQVDNGVVINPFASNVRAAVESFFLDIDSDTGDKHSVVSYMNDCEWRTTGVHTDVTSYTLTTRNLASQRRRLPGRGV